MSRPYEIGDTSQHWQAVVRQYMDGKDLSFEELGRRIGLSRVGVAAEYHVQAQALACPSTE